jgi:hypothetical protein
MSMRLATPLTGQGLKRSARMQALGSMIYRSAKTERTPFLGPLSFITCLSIFAGLGYCIAW